MRNDSCTTSAQYSLASSLAMPASTSLRWPASLSRAALTIRAWAASILVAISASLNATAWCCASGLPKVTRCWAYAIASSNARIEIPQARGGLAAARLLLQQEREHVAVRRVGAEVALHERGDDRGVRPVGQPHLLSIEDEAVAGAVGPGTDRGHVGAAARLGHRERAPDLAGGQLRQQPRLLVGGPVLGDQVRHDEVRVDDPRDGHPAPRQLLDDQRVGQQRLAEPAVLLGDRQAEQAHLAHPGDDLARVHVVVLKPLGVRNDLLVDELPHRLQDGLLDIGQARRLGEAWHGEPP